MRTQPFISKYKAKTLTSNTNGYKQLEKIKIYKKMFTIVHIYFRFGQIYNDLH